MKTEKEEAKELIDMMGCSSSTSFNPSTGKQELVYKNQYAKQCALIAASKMMDAYSEALQSTKAFTKEEADSAAKLHFYNLIQEIKLWKNYQLQFYY